MATSLDFDSPRQLMGFLGQAPSERSTADSVRRGGITRRAIRKHAAYSSKAPGPTRHPLRLITKKRFPVERAPRPVHEIAWKAQTRLSARTRALTSKGKRSTVIVAAAVRGGSPAIGREMALAR